MYSHWLRWMHVQEDISSGAEYGTRRIQDTDHVKDIALRYRNTIIIQAVYNT